MGRGYRGSTGTARDHPRFTWSDPCDGPHFRGGAIELGLNGSWTLNMAGAEIARRARGPEESAGPLAALIADHDGPATRNCWELPAGALPVIGRHNVPDIGVQRALADRSNADGATVTGKTSTVQTAAFTVAGRFDVVLQGTPDNHTALAAQGKPARLIVGPWEHGSGVAGSSLSGGL